MPDREPHYFQPHWIQRTDAVATCDVCIYGATAAGVIASITAVAEGKSVILLQPGQFIGGMTTAGLGLTDFGAKHVIGGRSRQFYRDLGKHYGREEEWLFEPHVATAVLENYLKQSGVYVQFAQYVQRATVEHRMIREIALLGGLRVRAKIFIDATYEGDLMALAGTTYTVGREANTRYAETINGVQIRDKHQFTSPVDPYVEPGNPASGVLPFVNNTDAAPDGSGDHRIQAYNFRLCMTDDPATQIAWPKPPHYDRGLYELGLRWLYSEKDAYNELLLGGHTIRKFDRLAVHSKTDTNNHGAVSSDFIGANYAWPEATYAQRENLFQQHVNYQQGLYWFIANDDAVPLRYRDAFRRWGLAGDEFTATRGWPHQLYVREARRMVSDYVLTERDTQHKTSAPDPVACGSYAMDSHNCQRIVRNGRVTNEGDVQLEPAGPYTISYRSIIPCRGEAENLLVPVCISASHIAYGSVRMEPAFMVLAESAALAACLAIDDGLGVQSIDYDKLGKRLEDAHQILSDAR